MTATQEKMSVAAARAADAMKPPPNLAWPEKAAARLFDPALRIDTRRLTLRPVTTDDAEALFSLFANWQVVRTLSAPPWPCTIEDSRGFLAAVTASSNDAREAAFAILRAGALIGLVGVRLRPASDLQPDRGPNVGYWIGEPYWGRGYMTEAAGGFLRFAFDACDCDAIYSGAFAENAASLRVQAKLGFVRVGETMLFSRPRGGEFPHINTMLTRGASAEAQR